MKLRLSAPSKTFLLGEYLVLAEGRALVVNTKPEFYLDVNLRGKGVCLGIHAQSPAGLYLQKHSKYLSKADLQFVDPHKGAGGYGASSAQYAMCFAAEKVLERENASLDLKDSLLEAWRTYVELCRVPEGHTPSGADVMSQMSGSISYVSMNPFSIDSFQWPFDEAGFLLISTGEKIATHEHLKSLEKFEAGSLRKAFDNAMEAFDKKSLVAFSKSVSDYKTALDELGFLHPNTKELIQKLSKVEGVLSMKGCGAMGSDVAFLLFDKNNAENVLNAIREIKLKIIATQEDVTAGLNVQVLPTPSLTRRLQT